ncbi:MAG: DNA-3-methyladenine glycosylase 2 family protein [Candidatus Marinimicrobia bacterium]|nr:DNA-3-methyladenine glycosylase 2 family protein [Candidatus Neomarinimicrobiota bacterium]
MNESANKLAEIDSRFTRLISEFGYPTFKRETNYFEALLKNIIYQQLSGKAAQTIYNRFLKLFETAKYPSPDQILNTPIEQLRGAGLSNQKVTYILNLSKKYVDGTLQLDELDEKSDKEVSAQLIQVKGIGQWTADMFLMFTLNREDIFPLGDLGVKKGVAIIENLPELPTEKHMAEISEKWQPYRTIAAWYMWKLVDGPFEW